MYAFFIIIIILFRISDNIALVSALIVRQLRSSSHAGCVMSIPNHPIDVSYIVMPIWLSPEQIRHQMTLAPVNGNGIYIKYIPTYYVLRIRYK